MKNAFSSLFIVISVSTAASVFAQNSKKEREDIQKANVSALIEAKRFVFQAQSVSPLRGGSRQLSPGYNLLVSPDTVISDLPFFGRAYQASPGAIGGGVKFTSTDFEYTVKDRKKGGWDITIKPKDVSNSQRVYISVSTDGNTSVRITSTDRDPISFHGFVEKIEKK